MIIGIALTVKETPQRFRRAGQSTDAEPGGEPGAQRRGRKAGSWAEHNIVWEQGQARHFFSWSQQKAPCFGSYRGAALLQSLQLFCWDLELNTSTLAHPGTWLNEFRSHHCLERCPVSVDPPSLFQREDRCPLPLHGGSLHPFTFAAHPPTPSLGVISWRDLVPSAPFRLLGTQNLVICLPVMERALFLRDVLGGWGGQALPAW